jgi:pimeloyl-ACP methyl ester carboxylesterase
MSSVRADDGIEIVYDDHSPDAAGVPVLLHHGFAADARANWDAPGITARLVESGRRVLAIDARGHGRSDKPHDPRAYDSPAMARDVSSLLDHLGIDSVDLVGYSMGGFVSVEVATREQRLRSLVVGGIGGGALPRTEGSGREGPPIDREAIAAAMEVDDASTITNPGAIGFRRLADATGADRLALAAVLRSAPHDSGDLSTIAVPTLVIAGDVDPLARGADRLAEAIPGARLLTVPGDHLGAVGSAELIDGLLAFLDELDKQAP